MSNPGDSSRCDTSGSGLIDNEDFRDLCAGFGIEEVNQLFILGKDHVYWMVIVEGRCTMARSSSLGANCSLVDRKV